MGKGRLANKRPCPTCGNDEKYKRCCKDKDEAKGRELFIEQPAIYDKKGNRHPIDNDIGKLLIQKGNGEVSEQDILLLLRKYNLKDTLILIGNYSRNIFHKNEDHFGQAGQAEKSTEIIVTQFALGYLASLLILSGASNDSLNTFQDDPYSFLALCNIYSNKLISPELEGGKKFDNDSLISFMVRMWYEQMSTIQFNAHYLITRNIVLFNHLAKENEPEKFAKLSEIFLKENGITIDEYIRIGFGFFAGTREHAVFRVAYLSNANIRAFENIFTEEKVENFLNVLTTNYEQFSQFDYQMNKDLEPVYTKNRFNPLFTYPFIKEKDDVGDIYVIPNMTAFVYKTFGGLFWWFNNYFEQADSKKKLHLGFREFFGNSIFEQYVGLILKEIYGDKNVNPEITYSKNNRFTDWQVSKENKYYLFEVKANQFALLSKQTGNLETIIKSELKKVVEAIMETYKNIKDIGKFEELEKFRNKEIIPIIVFLEIPLVSSGLYKDKITALLAEKEKNDNLIGLKDFKYHLLNIDELELYSCVKDKIDIEKVFNEIEGDMSQGFTSYISEINNDSPLHNAYLDGIYEDFFSDYIIDQESDNK